MHRRYRRRESSAATGQAVEVQNYIDDTGVQVADVVVGVRELGIAQDHDEAFDQYCSRVYVEVGKRYETQPDLMDKRRQILHDIEAGRQRHRRCS